MVNDDARDVAAAVSGGPTGHEAFARLFDRHGPVVLSLCRRHVGHSTAEAEDATQETFIRAHRLLDKLDDPAKFRPWLYGIARRVCSERRRSTSRRIKHEGAAMLNATAERRAHAAEDSAVERGESLERLTEAIEQLDDRERLAVHLYYLDADPVRSAAETLGLSRSGYYKLLARARERLALFMREVQPS